MVTIREHVKRVRGILLENELWRNMQDQDPGNHDGYTRIEDQDLAEIGRIVESWVGGLPFEAVYELVKTVPLPSGAETLHR